MSEELYITGPVIVNGIPDTDGDTLNSVEIRTIFTKYTNHLSDIQHDRIDYDGVDVLANWISEEDTLIQNNTIPAKSWLCTMKITNPETLTAIRNGELTCFSLGSVSQKGKTREGWFIDKRMSYHDLKSMDDVIPLRISIVDHGACGFPFMIENREVYINKNMETSNMTEENKKNDNEARFSFKEWLGIEKHFRESIDKAEETTPTPTPPQDESTKTIEELFTKLDSIESKLDKILEQKTEPHAQDDGETINKEDQSEEEEKEKPTEETKPNESAEKPTKPEEEEEEPKEHNINKSSTRKPADTLTMTNDDSDFYQNTGRDYFGRKIRR